MAKSSPAKKRSLKHNKDADVEYSEPQELSIKPETCEETPQPSTKTVAGVVQVIMQGLKSGDKELLETALAVSNEQVIKNSVARLSAEYVIPLLEALVERVHTRPNRGLSLVPWINTLLISHASFLLNDPQLGARLRPLQRIVQQRLDNHEQILRVAGRLEVAMERVKRKKEHELAEEKHVQQLILQPLAVYDDYHDATDEEREEDLEDSHGNVVDGMEVEPEPIDTDTGTASSGASDSSDYE